eukprot:scaffold266_cov248-Pinguiococcus_pyrenoidosus.AAC.18
MERRRDANAAEERGLSVDDQDAVLQHTRLARAPPDDALRCAITLDAVVSGGGSGVRSSGVARTTSLPRSQRIASRQRYT